MRSPDNQLIVVNMMLAVLAVITVCLGAPIVPAIAGAFGAGAFLSLGTRAFLARTGRSDSNSRTTRGE